MAVGVMLHSATESCPRRHLTPRYQDYAGNRTNQNTHSKNNPRHGLFPPVHLVGRHTTLTVMQPNQSHKLKLGLTGAPLCPLPPQTGLAEQCPAMPARRAPDLTRVGSLMVS